MLDLLSISGAAKIRTGDKYMMKYNVMDIYPVYI